MKILHVGNHTIPCVGGIENVIWQTAREQAHQENDVRILVFDTDPSGKEKLPAYEVKEGVEIIRIPQNGFTFYRIPSANRYLAELKQADIVHVHGINAWMDMACVLKPFFTAKIVVNTHGGFHHTTQRGFIKWIYARTLFAFSKRRVDHVIADSSSDAERLELGPSKKWSIIPNGIDLRTFLDIPLSGKDPFHLLYVGRISRNKRIDRLIEAFERSYHHHDSLRLSIVGEDWEGLMEELKIAIKKKGVDKAIVFHGKVSDAERLKCYRKAGFFVSASEFEGFGITVLEGMAAGAIPCISPIPTFETFVGTDRGFLVDFSNPTLAGEKMNTIFSLPTKKLNETRKKARVYAEAFSIEKIVEQYLKLYSRLMVRK